MQIFGGYENSVIMFAISYIKNKLLLESEDLEAFRLIILSMQIYHKNYSLKTALVIGSDFATITNYQLATFNYHVVLFRFGLQVF